MQSFIPSVRVTCAKPMHNIVEHIVMGVAVMWLYKASGYDTNGKHVGVSRITYV